MSVNTFRRNPAIEEAPLQGELMLFDPGTSKFFVLNRTMAYLWKSCDGQRSLADIVQGAGREFASVDASRVEVEFSDAVRELLSMGLLVESREVS